MKTICKMSTRDNSYTRLYEGIETYEEVELLSQLAMNNKRDDELIFIFAGWNTGLDKDQYRQALILAEKYKTDNPNERCKGDDRELRQIKEKLHRLIDTL
jgi:hypothetical protein